MPTRTRSSNCTKHLTSETEPNKTSQLKYQEIVANRFSIRGFSRAAKRKMLGLVRGLADESANSPNEKSGVLNPEKMTSSNDIDWSAFSAVFGDAANKDINSAVNIICMQCEYFSSENGGFEVTDKVQSDFDDYGYIVVRELLDAEELRMLRECVEADQDIQINSYGRDDGEGGRTKVSLWDHPSDDITGVVARSEKVAGTFTKLLKDEVYHYHGKIIMKDAKTGGAHVWHQDYGYWYTNGCLFPSMGTVFISLDNADHDNGCLKIIPKSHLAGRIEHGRTGDQAGADLERVNWLAEKLGVLHMEMKAGDALFFHSNILHRSDSNRSDRRRWAYLVSFNTKSNDPVKVHHHPQYTPMTILANTAIKDSATKAHCGNEEVFSSAERKPISGRTWFKNIEASLPDIKLPVE